MLALGQVNGMAVSCDVRLQGRTGFDRVRGFGALDRLATRQAE
jgi:hypothetical protein